MPQFVQKCKNEPILCHGATVLEKKKKKMQGIFITVEEPVYRIISSNSLNIPEHGKQTVEPVRHHCVTEISKDTSHATQWPKYKTNASLKLSKKFRKADINFNILYYTDF